MRLRNITGSKEFIAENEFVVHEPQNYKGLWNKEIFSNNNPIHIEVGMGKGRFIMALAKIHPDINYVGIEKFSSVLYRGIQKMQEEPLDNVVFIRMDAEYICDVFGADEIDKIYLNFSDPWPKDRHAKRRLPSHQFLEKFSHILKKGAPLEFKTDNRALFDFAMEEAPIAGWTIDEYTYDLHHDEKMNRGNIMTEYEERFSLMGNPICKYVIHH